jgi:hypothetical protein
LSKHISQVAARLIPLLPAGSALTNLLLQRATAVASQCALYAVEPEIIQGLQRCLPVLGDAMMVYGGASRDTPPLWLGQLAGVIFLKLVHVIELVDSQPALPCRNAVSENEGDMHWSPPCDSCVFGVLALSCF